MPGFPAVVRVCAVPGVCAASVRDGAGGPAVASVPMDGSRFAAGAEQWVGRLGQLRNVVRQEVLARQVAEHLAEPVSVLDVGCGQGTQALRLAEAGHHVTGLDPSASLLDEFRRALAGRPPEVAERVRLVRAVGEDAAEAAGSGYPLVLCHGVVLYQPSLEPLLGGIVGAADPERGAVSVLWRSAESLAMRAGLRGEWERALHDFDDPTFTNRLGVTARAHTSEELDAAMGEHGWVRQCWYGVRVFTDHWDDSSAPEDPGERERLLRAEERAARTDPYRQAAPLRHAFYRPGPQ